MINEHEKFVYVLIKENNRISISDIVEKTKISRRTVERIISNLKEKEIIERVGANKHGCWKLLK